MIEDIIRFTCENRFVISQNNATLRYTNEDVGTISAFISAERMECIAYFQRICLHLVLSTQAVAYRANVARLDPS